MVMNPPRISAALLTNKRIDVLLVLPIVCCLLSSCKITPNSGFDSDEVRTAGDITTLVLTAGQSNAVGSFSADDYNGTSTQDLPDERVWVWASVPDSSNPNGIHKWIKADVRKAGSDQVWIQPQIFKRVITRVPVETATDDGQSHGGFQIARHLVDNSENIVGIIPTGRSGMLIDSWWHNNQENNALTDMKKKASDAVTALVAKGNNNAKVGLVWWMQGESDAQKANTTIPTIASPAPDYSPSDFADEYVRKLNAIFDDLKGEHWFYPTNDLYKMFVVNHIYETNDSDYEEYDSMGERNMSTWNTNEYRAARPSIKANQRALNRAFDEQFDRGFEEITRPTNTNIPLSLNREFVLKCSSVSDLITLNKDRIHFDALTLKSIGLSVSNLYIAPGLNDDCVTIEVSQP